MPRKQKTSDPVLIALLDSRKKGMEDYHRNYTRLKRAFNRLEKSRQYLVRLDRRIEKYQQQTTNTSNQESQS